MGDVIFQVWKKLKINAKIVDIDQKTEMFAKP